MVAYTFYEADSRLIQYARALTRRGDSVDVIALARPGAPRVETIEGVHVYRIQERVINERSAVSYLFRILRFLFASMTVLTWRHLRRRYQLVHVHSVPDFLVLSALPLRISGIPVILDIHDILPEFYASKFNAGKQSLIFRTLLMVEKCSAKLASHVIIANRLWYERLIARSTSAEKCTVISNYPNSETFYPRAKQGNNERFLIMYPGSLHWHQGVDIAVRAFALASKRMDKAVFYIFGEGSAQQEIARLISELGLGDRIHMYDPVPSTEIAELMSKADLAVVPKRASSMFGNEAASTKIQEFMAVGVPVIVSRTKIDTLCFDESMVRFVESENTQALADAMYELYQSPEVRRKLIEGANRHIQKNNWEVKQHEYLQTVDSLTRGKSSFQSRGEAV